MQADKQTGTGGNRPALGPGKVTHWVVATVHVSGLGRPSSVRWLRPAGCCFPGVSGARLRWGGVEGVGRERSGRELGGKGGPGFRGGSDLQPPVRVWRARSGGGQDPELGWAGEGAGKLEQLRKVPKIPGGGGAGGGGPGNDALATPPRREGLKVSVGLLAPAASPRSRGATRCWEGPAGLGTPSSSLQGRRRGREGLSKLGEAPSTGSGPPPSPPPSWSNLGIFYPE